MTEPSTSEPGRDAVSRETVKAPVAMGVPLRVVVRNERRRRLGSVARSVAAPLGFIARYVLAGDNDDAD